MSFSKIVLAGVSKLHFTCPQETIEDFSPINKFYYLFSVFGQKNSGLPGRNFRQGCQNWFLRIQKKILRDFFWKNFEFKCIVGFWAESFRTFDETFKASLSKLHCTCPKELFGESSFSWVIHLFIVFLGCLAINFPNFVSKFTTGSVELRSLCPDEHFGKKVFFQVLFSCFLLHFRWKLFGRFLKNCILHVQRNILGKLFFFDRFLFFFCLPWAKRVRISGKTSRQSCQNSILLLQRKIYTFTTFSGHWAKHCQTFGKKKLAQFSK